MRRRLELPLLLRLLRAAAHLSSPGLDAVDPAEVRWAIETGFGPLLRQLLGGRLAGLPSATAALVRGADLTARLAAEERLDALSALLDRCAGLADPPTLLKGISVCEELYPAPHVRPMTDIDLLVDEAAIPEVEAALLALAYRRQSPNPAAFYATHHHTAPFTHPDTGVWVEVHRDLFPAKMTRLSSDPTFRRPRVAAERRAGAFRGRPVYRLSRELQLLYLSAHWALGLRRVSGLVPVLDTVYLLRATPGLDWAKVLSWLAASAAVPSVHLMLSYLVRHRLGHVPPEVMSALQAHPHRLGRAEIALLLRILDRHLLSARRPGPISTRNARIVWSTLLGDGKTPRGLLIVPLCLLPRIGKFWRGR